MTAIRTDSLIRQVVAFIVLTCVLGGLLAVGVEPADSRMSRQLDRLTRWLHSPRESIRLEAITELREMPAEHALPLLFIATGDTSAVVRVTAVESLSRIHDKRIVTVLRPLLKDNDEHVRAGTVWALANSAGKSVLPDVLPLCRDDASSLVRFRAVWGLGIIGDKSALPVAIDALGDFNAAVRERSALLALEALADGTVADRLLKQAKNEFPPTRRVVMYLFGRYGSAQQVVPALQAGLTDTEPLVRAEAALALGRRRAKNSIPELAPLLKDGDEHVRGAAAYALGLLGDASSQTILQPLLQDETAFVRAVAAESLQKLGDKTVKPPAGFRAVELFTYPIYSPEHADLYR